MANYNDYQLEDAENAAVNKSKNLKRGLAVGAAVVGAGAATAFGATKVAEGLNSETTEELTADDLMAGAQAGADGSTADAVKEAQEEPVVKQNNVYVQKEEAPADPELSVEETALIYDEDGNYVASVDSGTYDGKSFMVLDTDGNGKGDIMAYDENGNGIYEDHEIVYIDNETYDMGQGERLTAYQQDYDGDLHRVYDEPNMGGRGMAYVEPRQEGIDDIRNDFQDEKTGEEYSRDLAENNPDYNNHDDAQQYGAGMDDIQNDYAEYDGGNDYGYTEPQDDYTAYNDNFDEGANYDA